MIEIEGETLTRGRAKRELRVCGPGAFAVLKARAFHNRGMGKDAYDLCYVLQNYREDSAEGAEAVVASPAPLLNDLDAREAAKWLAEDFESVDHAGPVQFAIFAGGGESEELRADSWALAQDLLDRLP